MFLFRELVAACPTTDEKLSGLRDYARDRIPGVWHYPDDREFCPECQKAALEVHHLPQAGIRGYLGTGPFAIVSDKPSGDVHFQRGQAALYYSKLKTHGLENAFQTDVFNTANVGRDNDEQQALFLIQIEIVRPTAVLIMDMASRPRKRREGWHYSGPLQTMQQHFRADGFSFVVDPDFELRAATVMCEPPGGKRFSFEVYRIYHYTKLTDCRHTENPVSDWEGHFARAIEVAQLTARMAELKSKLGE
jgi:hypothetical protein